MNKDSEKTILDAAQDARQRAYAPYSQFSVGAALLCRTGRILSAGNVENASFGLSICAERLAMAQAVSAGEREFVALAVSVEREASHIPCGACLQFLAEFCPPDFPIYVQAAGDNPVTKTLGDLLKDPFRFQPGGA
jgi:cytidine deaminase